MWPFKRRESDKTFVDVTPSLQHGYSCKVSVNGGPWSEHLWDSWVHEGKEIVSVKRIDNARYRVEVSVKVFIEERRQSTPDAKERKPPMTIG